MLINIATAHSLAHDGQRVYTFGSGGMGRLGHGNTANKLVPTPITSGSFAEQTVVNVYATPQWKKCSTLTFKVGF